MGGYQENVFTFLQETIVFFFKDIYRLSTIIDVDSDLSPTRGGVRFPDGGPGEIFLSLLPI